MLRAVAGGVGDARAPVVFAESLPAAVTAIAWSPDHKRLALSSGELIEIWDVGAGREWVSLALHQHAVMGLAFSPDGSRLASASDDVVALWNVATGSLERRFEPPQHGATYARLAFSPDGRALGGAEIRGIAVWRIADGSLREQFVPPPGRRVYHVPLVVTGSGTRAFLVQGRDLEIWDVGAQRLVATLHGHAADISNVALGADGQRLVSASVDGQMILWDVLKATEVGRFRSPCANAGCWWPLALSRDGRQVVSHAATGGIEVRELPTGRVLTTQKVGTGVEAAFADDGHLLAVPGPTAVNLIDVPESRVLAKFSDGHPHYTAATFDRDATRVAALRRDNGGISWFSVATGEPAGSVPPAGVNGGIPSLAVTPDGGGLVLAERGGVFLWRGTDWQTLAPINDTQRGMSVAFQSSRVEVSPDGRLVAMGNDRKGFDLWDLGAGRMQATLDGLRPAMGGFQPLSFAPKGDRVAAIDGADTVGIWDARTGAKVASLQDAGTLIESIAWSLDGRHLALGHAGGVITIYDTARLTSERRLSAPVDVIALRWFGNDRWLIAGEQQGGILAFDLSKGGAAVAFDGQTSLARTFAPTADARQLVSLDLEGTLRYWDFASGRLLYAIYRHAGGGHLTITPEGYFTSTGPDVEQTVNVRVGDTVYGIENYRERFYRPDLVALARDGKPLPANVRSLATVKPAPAVELVAVPATVSTETLPLRLRIADAGGGIGDVRIYLNGTAVALDAARNLSASDAPTSPRTDQTGAERTIPVHLVAGHNEIRVIAFNADNSMSSNPATTVIEATLPTARRPSLHAIVVGIAEFDNPRLALKYSTGDAKAFAAALEQGARGIFDKVDIHLHTTREETTKAALLADLGGLGTIEPEDVFVFYIASHGTVEDFPDGTREYFLITSNVGSISSEAIVRSALGQQELQQLIARIPASKKALFIDACQSGAFGEELLAAAATRGLAEDGALRVLSRAMGSTVISASTSQQEALEGYQDHGVFTWVLVDGLHGKADARSQGFVTTSQIADYLETEVPRLAEQQFGRKQFPTTYSSGQGFPLVAIH